MKRKERPQVANLSPRFRQKYGIAPGGKGPHPAEEYGLPVPPPEHPLAKTLARATLRRAVGALAKYPIMGVVGQIRKANKVLYGKECPDGRAKMAGRVARHERIAAEPHQQHESSAGFVVVENGITRAATPADLAPISGEWLHESAKPGDKTNAALARIRESNAKAQVEKIALHVRLSEINLTGESPIAHVMIIREGPGNLGDRHWYTGACLAGASALFEGAHNYKDHPTPDEDAQRPGRSVKDLGGWFSDIEVQPFADPDLGAVSALYAVFHPQVGDDLTLNLLRTCAEYSKKYPGESYVGLSINAYGVGAPIDRDGEQWNQVDEITEVVSVDTVTRAGAKGRILTFQENDVKTKRTPRARRTTEAFGNPNVMIDIRTKSEREADAQTARKSVREAIRKSTFKALPKAARILVLEAAGMAPAMAATTPDDGSIPKLTDAQDQALDAQLGLIDGGLLDTALDTVLGGNDDASGSMEGDDDEEDVPLTKEQIMAMTPEQMQAALLGQVDPGCAPGTLPAGHGGAGIAPHIEAALAPLKAENERLARENSSLKSSTTAANKATIADRVMEQMKVPANFRPAMKRAIITANDENELIEAARDWVQAFIPQDDGAGIVAGVRENNNRSTTLYKPQCV